MQIQTGHKHYDKDSVREQTDLVDLLIQYGVPLKRAGRFYRACCPFHEEKTPSFVVDPQKQTWRCYGSCQDGGDIFTFIMRYHKMPFGKALHKLASDTGMTPDARRKPKAYPVPTKSQLATPASTWVNAMQKVCQSAEQTLWQSGGAQALDYLRGRLDANRGLPRRQLDQLIRSMHLGYLAAWTNTGIKDEDGEFIKLPPGILMPWFLHNELTAVQIRPISGLGAPSKYWFAKGSKPSAAPYVVGGKFIEGAPTFITESVIKAAAAALELPDWNCIGMGSVSFTLSSPMIEKLRDCPQIYLAMDNDPKPDGSNPGQQAQEQLATAIDSPTLRLCCIPNGKDVDGYLAGGGRLADLLNNAKHYAPNLPDTWRTALNQYTNAGALIIDLYLEARRAGYILPAGATVQQLVEAAQLLGRDCPDGIIRRGLSEGVKRGFFAKLPAPSLQRLDLEGRKAGKNAKKCNGRPSNFYQPMGLAQMRTAIRKVAEDNLSGAFALDSDVVPMITPYHIDEALADENPDPDELHPEAETIAEDLNARYGEAITGQPGYLNCSDRKRFALRQLDCELDRSVSTSLREDWKWKTVSQYKECVLRSLFDARRLTDRDGNQTDAPGKAPLADLIGVSKRGVGKVIRGAGLTLVKVYDEAEVADPQAILRLNRYDSRVKGFPLLIKFPEGGNGLAGSLDVRSEAARQVAATGRPARVVYQFPSRVEAVTAGQPPCIKHSARQSEQPVPEIVPEDLPPAPEIHSIGLPAPQTNPPVSYGLYVLAKLLSLATSWRFLDGRLHNKTTGEVAPVTGRTVIDLLQDKAVPRAFSQDRLHGSSPQLPAEVLIEWLCEEHGAVISKVEVVESAPEISRRKGERGLFSG